MRDQPEQQAPPVQRLRIRYAKRGRLRFTSHRDFSRAFERAMFRARVPMAYSSGFNPHPRISYAGASPTGSASEAEYLEIGAGRGRRPGRRPRALDEALPEGLDVLEVVERRAGSLADRLEASRWRLDARRPSPEAGDAAVDAFLAVDEVLGRADDQEGAARSSTAGPPSSRSTAASGEATGTVRLDVVLRHTVPAVRPDDVLTGLRAVGRPRAGGAPLLTRLAQGPSTPRPERSATRCRCRQGAIRRACAILAMVGAEPPVRIDPTTFSPVLPEARHAGVTVVARPRRGPACR